MNKTQVGGVLAAALLTLAACGGSDDASSDTAADDTGSTTAQTAADTDDTATASTTATETSDGASSDTAAPATGGYTIDSSACSDEASTPIADGEPIKLGITLTMTGPGSAPQLAEGFTAYMNQVNEQSGGIAGHPVEVIVKDDAFDAARAVSNVTEFIQNDGIFAVGAQQGSANIVAVQPVVEADCIPQFFVPAGLPAFGDPANHPWTSTGQIAYDIEANLWAQYLTDTYPDGAKVGLLVFNSAFGTDYVAALEAAIEGTPHEIVETKLHEATAVNVDNEITALVAAGPDVIFGATAGQACTQMMTATATAGFSGDRILSSLCLGIDSFFKPAGEAADGVMMIQSFKDPADPAYAADTAVQDYVAAIEQFADDGVDPLNGFVSAGYRNAALLAEAMNAAAASPEGLSRVSVANQVWNIDVEPVLGQDGIRFTMSGTDDAYPIESGTLFAYDAAGGTMVSTGTTLAAEGQAGSFGG